MSQPVGQRSPDRRDVLKGDSWRAHVQSVFAGTTPEGVGTREPLGNVYQAKLGLVEAFNVAGNPQVFVRSAADIGRIGSDHLKVCLQLRGSAIVCQGSREVAIEQGQLAVYDTGKPYSLSFGGMWSCAVLTLPRHALGMRHQAVAAAMDHPFPASDGAGAVLAEFLVSSVAQRDRLQLDTAARMGDAGLALLGATLANAEPAAPAPASTLRLEILAFVRAHLADPHLSHASVAAAHHMSARTLDRLFADEPCTVADYIRHLRLEGVRRDLGDPSQAHRTIASLASGWGFADPAHFSRLCRAKYGLSPSQLRADPAAGSVAARAALTPETPPFG